MMKPVLRWLRPFVLVGFVAMLTAGCSANPSRLQATATLISDVQAITPGRPFRLGLLIRMPRGAHIYWLNPGDIGVPTRVVWRGPEGFSIGPLQWPAPRRFAAKSLMSHGYDVEVVLWVEVTPHGGVKVGELVELGARVNWLLCREICVPGGADLTKKLRISDGPVVSSLEALLIDQYARRVPREPSGWRFEFEDLPDAVVLHAQPSARGGVMPMSGLVFIPSADDLIEPAAPQRWEPRGDGWFALRLAKTSRRRTTGEVLDGVIIRENGVGAEDAEWGGIKVVAKKKTGTTPHTES